MSIKMGEDKMVDLQNSVCMFLFFYIEILYCAYNESLNVMILPTIFQKYYSEYY